LRNSTIDLYIILSWNFNKEYEEKLEEFLDKYSKEIIVKTRMKKGYN